MPNSPRDQSCTVQIICVGIGCDVDAVVSGYFASGMEDCRVRCPKVARNEILGVVGEVEGAISGQSSEKTSIDWVRRVDVIPCQYTRALTEVWSAAWSLIMSRAVRGGR